MSNDIPRLPNTFWKSDTPKSERTREKEARKQTAKAKGVAGEEKAINELCQQMGRPRTKADRRNHQGRVGGGLGVPDLRVKGLEGWLFESKAEKNYRFSDYWKQLGEDCPTNKRPGLIYTNDKGETWLQIKLKDLANLAQDVVLGSGFDIV